MALESTLLIKNMMDTDRIIAQIEGSVNGPTVVFFAGIHGNENAGVQALTEVLGKLDKDQIKGTVYGIKGNIKALQARQRYIDEDLNRLWTKNRLQDLETRLELHTEDREQKALFSILNTIIETHAGPFYFIDLHTTSSKTLPFITINDALINRKFSKLFPVPIVLGIEEYLEGPLLSYINSLGYVSLGFESGQHNDDEAIRNSISFIYLTLKFTETFIANNQVQFSHHFKRLTDNSKGISAIFEVVYLHRIQKGESFKMLEGFKSFQHVSKNTVLAISNDKPLRSRYNAKIFMPLYQKKGKEGFFIIKQIPPFFLNLSSFLRQFKADQLLLLLPGVSWADNKKALLVNLRTARFFARSIFHLLGYRNKEVGTSYIKLYNRERTAKQEMYKNEKWY